MTPQPELRPSMPRPLSALAAQVRSATRGVRAVLADIDDTISSGGRITAGAYAALERLQAAGLLVIPITGRPAGWCDHIARMWPVDAIVGENGAFYMRYDRALKKLKIRHVQRPGDCDASPEPADRGERRRQLHAIGDRILQDVPGTAWASDQPYRLADIAIDFCEDVPRLPPETVDRIAAQMREEGLTAKVSSIHVNGWFGDYDKLGMTRTLMRDEFGIDIDEPEARETLVFVGDSPNDAPMFGFFPLSVGVANVADFGDRIPTPPRFVTAGRSGDGFVELADLLIAGRAAGV